MVVEKPFGGSVRQQRQHVAAAAAAASDEGSNGGRNEDDVDKDGNEGGSSSGLPFGTGDGMIVLDTDALHHKHYSLERRERTLESMLRLARDGDDNGGEGGEHQTDAAVAAALEARDHDLAIRELQVCFSATFFFCFVCIFTIRYVTPPPHPRRQYSIASARRHGR